MKRFICFLLSFVLILSLLGGCSTNVPTKSASEAQTTEAGPSETAPSESAATVPAVSGEETQPSPSGTAEPTKEEPRPAESTAEPAETTAVPETTREAVPGDLSASEAYERAVQALPKDYHLFLSREISRTLDKDLLLTSDTWEMEVRNAGTEDMTVSVRWDRLIENNQRAYDPATYQIFFANGKALMTRDGESFAAELSAEAFLASFPPLALLTQDNYETIDWADEARTQIRFTDAVDTEWEWLGMDCTDVSSTEGSVMLDSAGGISEIVYDTVYALEGISFTAHARMELTAPGEEPQMPQETGKTVRIDHMELIPIMDLAACFADMENFSASYLGIILSYAAGATILSQEWVALDEDESGPMVYDHAYRTVYADTTESSEMELRHFDGTSRYLEDGEEQEVTATPEDLADSIVEYVNGGWLWPSEMDSISLQDETDCWLIEFTLGKEKIEALRQEAEIELFGNPNQLEEIGARFKAGECTGYLSVDKGSGMPIHLKVNFDASHLYQRQSYPLQYEAEWTYRAADPDVWNLITEELRPSEVPEDPATPLFYKVTDAAGHSLWLLGTIHVGDEITAHLPQEIYDALLGSDALAVEIDVTNMEERLDADEALMEAYQNSTYYNDGTNAYDHLEEDVAKQLETAIKKYGGDIRLNWLSYNVASLTSLLEQLTLELGRMQSYDRGVDNQLVKMAKDNGIEVRDVEDFAEHISLLGNFSEELQALMLKETLDAGRYGSNMGTDELFDAWCRGDEEELTAEEEEEETDEELTPEEQALIDEYNEGMMRKRNAEMRDKVLEYMNSGETIFFAVGLAHLLDEEDGLLLTLPQAGLTVERVVFEK